MDIGTPVAFSTCCYVFVTEGSCCRSVRLWAGTLKLLNGASCFMFKSLNRQDPKRTLNLAAWGGCRENRGLFLCLERRSSSVRVTTHC